MRMVLALFALSLSLAGCAATKVYKEGAAYEESGNEFQAANKYLDALDLKDTHKKAKESLVGVVEAAYKEKLALAERYETTGNYASALEEYRALDRFLGRLKKVDALTFAAIDAKTKIAEMESSAAEERYVAAEALLAKHDFLSAVEAYRAAQGFKAAYKDTDEKIAIAYYGLAEKELTTKHYRKAGEHFAESLKTGGQGFRDAAKRGGDIYLALGTHFLEADRCRQAVRDLRLADALSRAGSSDPRRGRQIGSIVRAKRNDAIVGSCGSVIGAANGRGRRRNGRPPEVGRLDPLGQRSPPTAARRRFGLR